MTPNPTPHQVLDLPLPPNDADAATVRDYLVKLLTLVWRDGECFDGKRPFGNSGWDYDLFVPMVKAGMVQGSFDEDDDLMDLDEVTASALIRQAIEALATT